MTTSPGQTFLDQHMAYINAKDVDRMVDNQYTEDAVLISPFDILPTPPPHIVRGRPTLKDFFRKYLDWQGALDIESFYDVVLLDDSICFQAMFRSATGHWVVGDDWHLRDGMIDRHYSFAYKLE